MLRLSLLAFVVLAAAPMIVEAQPQPERITTCESRRSSCLLDRKRCAFATNSVTRGQCIKQVETACRRQFDTCRQATPTTAEGKKKKPIPNPDFCSDCPKEKDTAD